MEITILNNTVPLNWGRVSFNVTTLGLPLNFEVSRQSFKRVQINISVANLKSNFILEIETFKRNNPEYTDKLILGRIFSYDVLKLILEELK